MFSLLIILLLGILIGVITGLLPGIHINLLSVLLLSLSPSLLSHLSPLSISVLIISIAITHIFIDILPSTYLSIPNEDYSLSSYPAHKLLLQGNAYQAIILTLLGALTSIILFSLSFPLIIPLAKHLYPIIKEFIPYILILTSLFLILKEKQKLLALILFLLSGSLGLASLNLPINQPLLPLLSGLFGSSILILSIRNKPVIPEQKTEFPEINKKEFTKSILSAFLTSLFTGFLPAITSSQSSTISISLFKKLRQETYLIITGFTSSAFAILSLIAIFSIDKARAGFIIVISRLLQEITFSHLSIFITTSLITASLSFIIAIKLSKLFSKLITRINYQLISISTLIFLSTLVLIISGPLGFLLFITSTSLGIIPQLKSISKIHLMGSLILPTILLLL